MRSVLAVDLGGTKTSLARVDETSGKALSELADVAIDNCVAPVDAQVGIGRREKVAAGSTVAAGSIAMALVAETGARLAATGHEFQTFVSPNVPGLAPDHNLRVFDACARRWHGRATDPVVR